MDVSHSGRYLAAGLEDGHPRVWDWRSGQPLADLKHTSGVEDVAFTSDERQLVTANLDGTAYVESRHPAGSLTPRGPNGDEIHSMTLSPDDRYLATGEIGTVRVWNRQRIGGDDDTDPDRSAPVATKGQ